MEAFLNCRENQVFINFWYGKYRFCLFLYFEFKNRTTTCKNLYLNLISSTNHTHNPQPEQLFTDFQIQIRTQRSEFHQKGLGLCNKDLKLSSNSFYNTTEFSLKTFSLRSLGKFLALNQPQIFRSERSLFHLCRGFPLLDCNKAMAQ